jgi:adenosylcobinamide-GDP ribazoletransferase
MPPLPPRWDDAARWWDEFRLAAAFLTRLPLGSSAPAAEMPLAPASWAFPLVGIVVGLLGGLGYALAAWLNIPPLPAALVAVSVTISVTGGLHEDGLADTADGFFGAAERDEKLAIMRDSRTGNFGVLALILSVGLRAAALAAIGQGGRVAAALVAAHAIGRGFLPLVLRALEPARADGLGVAAGRPEATMAWLAAGLAVPIALVALDFGAGLVALLAAALVMALGARVAQRQIGGYTGDVLGALEQGGEAVVLLVAAAWAT